MYRAETFALVPRNASPRLTISPFCCQRRRPRSIWCFLATRSRAHADRCKKTSRRPLVTGTPFPTSKNHSAAIRTFARANVRLREERSQPVETSFRRAIRCEDDRKRTATVPSRILLTPPSELESSTRIRRL